MLRLNVQTDGQLVTAFSKVYKISMSSITENNKRYILCVQKHHKKGHRDVSTINNKPGNRLVLSIQLSVFQPAHNSKIHSGAAGFMNIT